MIEEDDEEEKDGHKDLSELAQQMKFDFSKEELIKLGEIEEQTTVLKELLRLRFEAADEMQKGGIMQIKGVILSKSRQLQIKT